MKIKMIKTTAGANDGIRVVEYQAWEVYDLSDSLSKAFLGMGVAEEVVEQEEEQAPDNAAIFPVADEGQVSVDLAITENEVEEPENEEVSTVDQDVEEKMQNQAPENKSTKPGNNKKKMEVMHEQKFNRTKWI